MKEEKSVLIVSGLGALDEYLLASAVALRFRPGAKLAFASRAALPDVLEERMGEGTGEVLLLGVGLTGDPGRLAAFFGKLRRKKGAVTWISASAYPLPAELPESLTQYLEARVGTSGGLTDAVVETLGGGRADALAICREIARTAGLKAWRERIAAVEWNFANTRDFVSLETAARDLARHAAEPQWEGAARRLVKNYRQFGYRRFETSSPAMRRLRKDVTRVARSAAMRILVTGESGVGKETVAQQIHIQSGRQGPLLAFNCATVAKELLESRLFGHAKGAFTGATEARPGLFREADGGTLFLDEIGELPIELQGLLLRTLQEGRIQPVGESQERKVDVRVVAATNRDLAALVREGRFRADLYWRLSAVELAVPPLRDRAEDFRPIARDLWKAFAPKRKPISDADLDVLAAWDWPGNVRQLANVLERAALFEDRTLAELLAEEMRRSASLAAFRAETAETAETAAAKAVATGGDAPLDEVVRAHVRAVWERHGRNASEAARVLGITRNTLRAKLG